MNSALIYTDLDGTLLDHHTYSFDAARSTLAALKRARHPGDSLYQQDPFRDGKADAGIGV